MYVSCVTQSRQFVWKIIVSVNLVMSVMDTNVQKPTLVRQKFLIFLEFGNGVAVVWCRVVWWYGVVLCHMECSDPVCGVVCCGMVCIGCCGMILYDMM